MTHLWAVILGVVQGFTEFLPISSTAHLKMIPWMFNAQQAFLYSTQFDIALHAGSFFAILLALWTDWAGLVKGAVAREREKLNLLGFLLVTSIPGALIGAALDRKVEVISTPANVSTPVAETFRYAPLVVGAALIVFGTLLWAIDHYVARQEPLEGMTWGRALVIGFAQALALIPGVSRSGSTMTAGRALGLSREAVARYSFMAALPIIGGAAVFGLKDVPPSQLFSVDWVLGFLAAFAASVVAMRWMLSYVRERSFLVFAVYRLAVGALLIALFFIRG